MKVVIPEGYKPALDVMETEIAIKELRVHFEEALCKRLNLTRISAPLYVLPETGLNDNLNGVERPVSFDIKETGKVVEIVHSLAKWKRYALKKYGFSVGQGMYTNMNAIRRDEDTDNIHSIYVDQWDWERIILKEERTEETLKKIVCDIYEAMKQTEEFVCRKHPTLKQKLPDEIVFIKTQQLEDEYPRLSPKAREHAAAKKHGAVFLTQIGGALKSGEPHDGRAPDYDDWSLNGDIIVYFPVLDIGLEMSSMGIRVDEAALRKQLAIKGRQDMEILPFQKAVLEGSLPYTIGGGIGQSRLCMFLLDKAHIGEVQVSVWPQDQEEACRKNGIELL